MYKYNDKEEFNVEGIKEAKAFCYAINKKILNLRLNGT